MTWQWVPRLYAADLVFPEGPTWHDGALWVTDVAAGGVHRLGPERSTFLADRRGMGGLVATQDGDVLASGRDLVRVSDGAVVRPRPAGSTGLNDLGTDATGALYAGVLTFRPTAGEAPTPGAVARLTPAGDDWDWWSAPRWPNGIAALPDGGLVVADFADGSLWRHGNAWEMFGRSPTGHADGLALDVRGAVWVATGPGATVECWSAEGELLTSHPVPAAFVSSVCFGGPDLETLFLTVSGYGPDGSGAVLATAAQVPGSVVPPAAVG